MHIEKQKKANIIVDKGVAEQKVKEETCFMAYQSERKKINKTKKTSFPLHSGRIRSSLSFQSFTNRFHSSFIEEQWFFLRDEDTERAGFLPKKSLARSLGRFMI